MKRLLLVTPLLVVWFIVAASAPGPMLVSAIALVSAVATLETLLILGPLPGPLALVVSAVVGIGTLVEAPAAAAAIGVGAAWVGLQATAVRPAHDTVLALSWCSLALILGLSIGTLSVVLQAHGRATLLLLCACTWKRDIVAALVGRLWPGGRAIAPNANPRKTWRVSLLAALMVLPVGIGAATLLGIEMPVALATTAAAVVGGQGGDLLESLVKRANGDRHSSLVFSAEQGGVLDAFDGFIFSAPLSLAFVGFAAYWF